MQWTATLQRPSIVQSQPIGLVLLSCFARFHHRPFGDLLAGPGGWPCCLGHLLAEETKCQTGEPFDDYQIEEYNIKFFLNKL